MKIVTVNVPEDFIKKAIIGELNSYSYNAKTRSIMYLHDFSYNEKGEVVANVESYLVDERNRLVNYFNMENPVINGMRIIDTQKMDNIDEMADLMTRLMEFCESRPCFKTTTSVFENIESPVSTTIDDKASDTDIIIPIPDSPIKFGNPDEVEG